MNANVQRIREYALWRRSQEDEELRRVKVGDYPDPPFTAWVIDGTHIGKRTVVAFLDGMGTCRTSRGEAFHHTRLYPTWQDAHRRVVEVAREDYKRAARRLAAAHDMEPPEEAEGETR